MKVSIVFLTEIMYRWGAGEDRSPEYGNPRGVKSKTKNAVKNSPINPLIPYRKS